MNRAWRGLVALAFCFQFQSVSAQEIQKEDRVAAPWPGAGVMVAGELWDSFLPPNAGPYYSESGQPLVSTFLRIGNFDRAWSTPTHMWPGGWPYGMFWGKGMYLTEFNPDTTWNPAFLAGSANPARHPLAGSSYAFGSYASTVLGGEDQARNFTRETRWADPESRFHAMYEAGWPTNIGVDVVVRIHQFTLNWNNFNDFILVEIILRNTGVLDMNADGIPDTAQSGRQGLNRIRALTMLAHGEMFATYTLGRGGNRMTRFGPTPGFGYVADPDRTGSPHAMMVAFVGEEYTAAGDMGLSDGVNRYYADVWSAWAWIAAKGGSASPAGVGALPDKQTLYGTDGIGKGADRGVYTSAGQGKHLGVGPGGYLRDPGWIHTASMGTWYAEGGRSGDSLSINRSPDPNFFSAGIAGDPTSFVPAAGPQWPRGDRKLTQQFEVNAHEGGWTRGFSGVNWFDGDVHSGIGPFSLEPGESMTVVWAEAGGFRFDGVANAMAAARWTLEHGFNVPEPPAAPEMSVENTVSRSLRVRWDERAESATGFSGYKIYRATTSTPVDWLAGGMRGLDRYPESTFPGPTPDSLLRPVNPSFKAFEYVQGRTGIADGWGPYRLVASIPTLSLMSFLGDGLNGLRYSWEDRDVVPGYSYWYTVAAVRDAVVDLGADLGGTNPSSAQRLESSNVNRNGAAGIWQGIYPFADLSPLFPASPEGRRALGAGVVFTSGISTPGQLAAGAARVSVYPNPYRLNGAASSWNPAGHQLMFLNLPAHARITILDVSGQVIQQMEFVSPDGDGSMTWDLRSKNGIEVASGLYIYVVEYQGGRSRGAFSILR